MTKNSGRREAQRKYRVDRCEKCGAIGGLQRHHRDGDPTNNKQDNISVLCPSCHAQYHLRIKEASCVVCGTVFRPARTRRATLCKDPRCRVVLGEISAKKRRARV